ncbi:MAG: CD1871A family CXXC motif-containing protein [Schaedlerella sp.]|nr:CD1871A family CXXC motif-containing protein [Schaedlerella sp.]
MKSIKIWVLVVALVLLGIGISQNGQWDMLNKAIRICYECIGIG